MCRLPPAWPARHGLGRDGARCGESTHRPNPSAASAAPLGLIGVAPGRSDRWALGRHGPLVAGTSVQGGLWQVGRGPQAAARSPSLGSITGGGRWRQPGFHSQRLARWCVVTTGCRRPSDDALGAGHDLTGACRSGGDSGVAAGRDRSSIGLDGLPQVCRWTGAGGLWLKHPIISGLTAAGLLEIRPAGAPTKWAGRCVDGHQAGQILGQWRTSQHSTTTAVVRRNQALHEALIRAHNRPRSRHDDQYGPLTIQHMPR